MENTIKFFWNGIKVNGKLNKFRFGFDSINYGVNFYADDYAAEMPKECGVAVINNSDSMTDYFEKDHGTIYPEHPLFKFFNYAANMAIIHHCKNAIKWHERCIARLEKGMEIYPNHEEDFKKNIESHRADIAGQESRIAEMEMMENPGQPTEADFEKVAAYLAEKKAKAEAEKAAQEAKEEAERAEARERTEKFVAETIKKHTEAFPLVEGAPVVEIGYSEMQGLPGGGKNECLRLSVAAADRILGELDVWQHNVRETSDFYGWYHKTDFAIKWTENGEECSYQGRYDLGDGEGGMLNHIRNFGEWSRTHGQFGAVLENPPETNDVLEMVKKFETFTA